MIMNEKCLAFTLHTKGSPLFRWNLSAHSTVQKHACDQHVHDSAQIQLRTVSFITGQR
jgi:hypothetical protein